MSPARKTTTWVSAAGLTLLGVMAVVFVFVNTPRSSSEASPAVPPALTSLTSSSPTSEQINVQTEGRTPPPTVEDLPKLTPVDYPPGSVGDTCGVNDFPSRNSANPTFRKWYRYRMGNRKMSQEDEARWNVFFSRFNPNGFGLVHWHPLEIEISQTALKNDQCRTALEQHVNQLNPYLWGRENYESFEDRALAFTVLDDPMTFERIFTDPQGDLVQVHEALARPECQLAEGTANHWHLSETCHAAAFHNVARIMWVCYHEGLHNERENYRDPLNRSPEERDHTMWLHSLEYHWVKEKCNSLDPKPDPQSPMYAEILKQIARQLVNDSDRTEAEVDDQIRWIRLDVELTKLAARLGDDAAGLTGIGSSEGRFASWFEPSRNDPANLFYKHPPSVDRLQRFMALFTENQTTTDNLVYDHEALVQHLCTPPYYYREYHDPAIATSQIYIEPPTEPPPDPSSCRTVVNDLRQEFHGNESMLELIATFEDIAIRLDVYELDSAPDLDN